MAEARSLGLAALLACSLTAACSPTNETDPSKVSWYDLWFGQDRLEQHLDSKRQELAGLKTQSEALEQRLADRQQKLEALNAAYREESSNTAAVRA